MSATIVDREPESLLWFGFCVLGEFASRLLQGNKGHPAPLRQKAQVRIAAQRCLMAELAQEVAYAAMVLQIPGRQVRWQPLDLKSPGRGGRRQRLLQYRPKHGGIAFCSDPQPVVEIALRPEFLRRDEHAPAGPKGAREHNGSVSRIAVERHVDPARSAKQRQPRWLPAVRPIEAACPGILESGHEDGQGIGDPLAQDHRSLPGIATRSRSAARRSSYGPFMIRG
jgi:hypothetical protein